MFGTELKVTKIKQFLTLICSRSVVTNTTHRINKEEINIHYTEICNTRFQNGFV